MAPVASCCDHPSFRPKCGRKCEQFAFGDAESDDPAEGYANLLNYQQWMEFETKVMLKVEDAMPLIGAYLG
jgi:hypothetical protein